MPSSKKPSDVFEFNNEEYEYNEDYKENRWCENCSSQEIFMNGLCECCHIQKRVDIKGVVSFDNDYWMNSACDTGIRLRKSWDNLHVGTPMEEDTSFPPPVYVSTDFENEVVLKVLNPTKKEEVIRSKTTFKWDTVTTYVSPAKVTGGKTAYVPPHRRCPSP